jgi:arylsulfatase A
MQRPDRRTTLLTMAMGLGLLANAPVPARAEQVLAERPNIVYILADDLGYGDLGCLNKDSKIRTPNLDRLAAQGMIFTDAHSGSAVCTPTRYGILTGRYAWRTRLQNGVLNGHSLPLIAPDRLTVAKLLKQQGYRTACVGKWHLGLGWSAPDPATLLDNAAPKAKSPEVDYTRPFSHGPTTLGFDEYFGISASLDMPPYIYLQDDRTVGVPTTEKTIVRTGPAHKDFEAVDVLPTLARKAVEVIDGQKGGASNSPLFLYLPLTAPHAPVVPDATVAGKSGIAPYADFVMQVDDAVGRVLDAIDRNGMAGNTLVFLTSDNGCSPTADFPALAKHGHNPNYRFRGYKADIYEGGHRIPFIVRWPGKVKPGSTCDDTICLTDLMATVAAIVGAKLPDGAGEDSVSILPDLLGTANGPLREATVHHSIQGAFAIRQGPWKLELCAGSAGWSFPRPGQDAKAIKELPTVQLYHLGDDLAESRNVQAEHPEVVARLTRLLERYVSEGRSTPGSPRSNDRPVQIVKNQAL